MSVLMVIGIMFATGIAAASATPYDPPMGKPPSRFTYAKCLIDNIGGGEEPLQPLPELLPIEEAKRNAVESAEDLNALRRWIDAWVAIGFDRYGQRNTSLFVRDIDTEANAPERYWWNPENNGADNYPYMVLTALVLRDERLLERLRQTLRDERTYASRYDGLAGNYDLLSDRQFPMLQMPGYNYSDVELSIRHTSEYVRDGLLTITEATPEDLWQGEAHQIIRAMQRQSNFSSTYGMLPFDDTEGNGYALQAYVRFFYMTNDSSMLPAIRALADAYLFEVMNTDTMFPALVWDFRTHEPKTEVLKLREHGQEIIEGLVLAYLLEHDLDPASERTQRYQRALAAFLRNLQQHGVNPDGIFYSKIDRRSGTPLGKSPAYDRLIVGPLARIWKRLYPQETMVCLGEPLQNYDAGNRIVLAELTKTFGYIYNGYLMFADVADMPEFRDDAAKALQNLPKYRWHTPEMISDSAESAFYLYKNLPGVLDHRLFEAWVTRGIRDIRAAQTPTGFFEGWYAGEGNVARALVLHSHYLTQGVRVADWQSGIALGAQFVPEEQVLYLYLANSATAEAALVFDRPRHRELGLRADYPRTQMLMEWYPIWPERRYEIADLASGEVHQYRGATLIAGIPVSGSERMLAVRELR